MFYKLSPRISLLLSKSFQLHQVLALQNRRKLLFYSFFRVYQDRRSLPNYMMGNYRQDLLLANLNHLFFI